MVADQELNASVDGKWAKQSEDSHGNPLVMVNVLAHDLKLCLDQWPASKKRCEPKVLREQLGRLFEDYPGLRLLTMDALYAERDLCKAIVSHGRDYLVRIKGNQPEVRAALADGFAVEELGEPAGGDPGKKAGVIERRRIWTDEALADYIRDELGFPGARQGAMVEKENGGHSHRGGEPGALVSADQPEFPAVRTERTASRVPQPLER